MLKLNKRSAKYFISHSQDKFTDLGFDYRGHLFEKSVSKEILKNDNNCNILLQIEKMIIYLIDSVKQIKLHYMISLDKNDTNLN